MPRPPTPPDDHDDETEQEGFAGLPTTLALPAEPERPYREFTLPESMISKTFALRGFAVADKTFRMVELGSRAQDNAAKQANGNGSVLSRLLMFAAISHIGGRPTANDYPRLEAWWEAIGPKAKRLIEAAFMEMQSVTEADVATFLAAGREGVG